MNEFLFVEFLFTINEETQLTEELNKLGEDFIRIPPNPWRSTDVLDVRNWVWHDGREYIKMSGRIRASAATLFRLKYPTLAEKMKVSYISDSMKDMYRT